jgi:hypothetical protein
LDYAELRGLSDPIEVTRRIVDAACGPIGLSTIEDHEQRMVAAEIAEWVIGESQDGSLPAPDEIARKTIALIITEVVASETGEMLRQGKQPGWANEIAEHELREAAEALAARADLSVDGVTENEFASAIENGIETLRRILGGST